MGQFEAYFSISRAVEDDEGRWIVEGYATVADVDEEDRFLTEEALRNAEKDLLTYSTVLHNHNRNEEIGRVLESKYIPEEKALWVKILISKTVPDIWQKIKEGVLNKLSVYGKARDWEWKFDEEAQKSILYVNKIDLFETSLVSIPSQPESRTLAWYVERSLKGGSEEMKKEDKTVERQVQLSDQTVKDLLAILDQLLATDITDEQRTLIRKVKAVLSQQSGGTYPYPGPTQYPGAITREVEESLSQIKEQLDKLTKVVEELVPTSSYQSQLDALSKEVSIVRQLVEQIPVRRGVGATNPQHFTETDEYKKATPHDKLKMLLGVKV